MNAVTTTRRTTATRLVSAGEWAYAAAVVATVVAVRGGGDRWGWATVLAYGPRAIAAVPAVPLAAVVLVQRVRHRRRRGPWVTAAAVLVLLFGGLGLNVPLSTMVARDRPVALRLIELNANGDGTDDRPYDRRRLAELVARDRPDVLMLAEWPAEDAVPGGPWDVRRTFDVAVASRYPIGRTVLWSARPFGGEGAVLAAEVSIDGRPTWVVGLHLETPRRGLEPVLHRQPDAARLLAESTARRRRLSASAAAFVRDTVAGDDVVIAGDFNEVADGAIYRDTWAGWPDAFDRVGWGFGWTKFQSGWGVRIDHVLVGRGWAPRRCWVGPDVGSDHRPVLAELSRP